MSDSSTEFLEAIKAGAVPKAAALLDREPTLIAARATGGESAVQLAIYSGRPNVVRWLLQKGATLDLFEAAALGEVAQVKTILDGDPSKSEGYSKDGWTALHLASFFGHADVVRLLVAAGARRTAVSRNKLANTPLHAAVAARRATVVDVLLAAGADPDSRETNGLTPLHLAALNGDVEIIRRLIAAGADRLAQAPDGRIPVEWVKKDQVNAGEITALLQ
ncbi:MAG: ankyrin repeat domain-containing protein [Rhodospirillaceae bacterium]|nr:ankyrin repeat domain-containing protein [Rhodospirillaceae bacterium]